MTIITRNQLIRTPDHNDFVMLSSHLLGEIGIDEAVVLHHLEFKARIGDLQEDGKRWLRATIADINGWMNNAFKKPRLQRVLKSLESQGLIKKSNAFNQSAYDRTLWYSINYDVVNQLESVAIQPVAVSIKDDKLDKVQLEENEAILVEKGYEVPPAQPEPQEAAPSKPSPKPEAKKEVQNTDDTIVQTREYNSATSKKDISIVEEKTVQPVSYKELNKQENNKQDKTTTISPPPSEPVVVENADEPESEINGSELTPRMELVMTSGVRGKPLYLANDWDVEILNLLIDYAKENNLGAGWIVTQLRSSQAKEEYRLKAQKAAEKDAEREAQKAAYRDYQQARRDQMLGKSTDSNASAQTEHSKPPDEVSTDKPQLPPPAKPNGTSTPTDQDKPSLHDLLDKF